MLLEEKKAIDRLNEILKEWQEIVNIEDKTEREIEMSLYMEDMPFEETKIALNLITKLQKENETTIKLNANMSKRHLNDIFKIKKLQKENEEKDNKVRKIIKRLDNDILRISKSKEINRWDDYRRCRLKAYKTKTKEIKDYIEEQYFEKLAKEKNNIEK